MVNYENGKIYKIESHSGDKIYIGSTTKKYLSQRMDTHRADYKRWKNIKHMFITSISIFEEYGIENCNIVLLELCPCECKDMLLSREAHYIKKLACVNKVIPGRTKKEWDEDNKEKISEYSKDYYEDKKEKINEKMTCDCGGCFTKQHKSQHEKTNKHQKYLKSFNLITQ